MTPPSRHTPRPVATLTESGEARVVAAVTERAAAVAKEVNGDITEKLATLLDVIEDERNERKAKVLSAHFKELVGAAIAQHQFGCPLIEKVNAMEKFKVELQGMVKGAVKTVAVACGLITLAATLLPHIIKWVGK